MRRAPAGRIAVASCVAALLAGSGAHRAWSSLVDHAPGSVAAAPKAASVGPPLSPRVLLVLVDGLGEAPARRLGALSLLAARGALFTCAVAPPSLSRPGRATLLTGARPHLHGATTNFHQDRPAAVPSLLDGVEGARVWGSKLWRGLFPRGWSGGIRVTRVDIHHAEHRAKAEELFAAERGAVAEAVAAVETGLPFGVIDLLGVDSSSHDHGVGSAEQEQALAHVDAMLGALAPAVLDRGGTLVVTADHGHVAEGGHGGDEPEVTAVPLLLAGAGIRAGVRGSCAHLDVAPTLAALLGVPAPAAAEGRVLREALVAEPATVAPAASPAVPSGSVAGMNPATVPWGLRHERSSSAPKPPSGFRGGAVGFAAAVGAGLLLALGARAAGVGPAIAFGAGWGATAAALVRVSGLRLSLSGINDEVLLVPYFTRVLLFAALAGVTGLVTAAAVATARERMRLATTAAGALAFGQGLLLLFAALVHLRHSLVVDGPIDAIGPVFLAFAALVGSLGLAPLVLIAWAGGAVAGRRRGLESAGGS